MSPVICDGGGGAARARDNVAIASRGLEPGNPGSSRRVRRCAVTPACSKATAWSSRRRAGDGDLPSWTMAFARLPATSAR